MQLEARELHGEDVVVHLVGHGLEDRPSDVAHRSSLEPTSDEHRLGHLGGRRLAIGTGDAQPGHDAVGMHETPGELRFTPHRHIGGQGLGDERLGRTPSRRDDDEIGSGRQLRRRSGPQPHRGAQDLQQIGLVPVVVVIAIVQDEHRGVQVEQRIGSCETRHSQTSNDHLHTRPVEEPVGSVKIHSTHCPATHSP